MMLFFSSMGALAVDEWHCSNCGQESNIGNFCPNCGSANPNAEWICLNCNQTGNKGNFCFNCGCPRPGTQTPSPKPTSTPKPTPKPESAATLRVKDESTYGFMLYWDEVTVEGKYIRYQIEYKPSDSSYWRTLEDEWAIEEYYATFGLDTSTLLMNTTYDFRIRPFYPHNDGNLETRIYGDYTTLKSVTTGKDSSPASGSSSDTISAVSVSWLSSSNVRVTWRDSAYGQSYRVTWRMSGCSSNWYNDATDNLSVKSVVLTSLIPGQTYTITVSSDKSSASYTYTMPTAGEFTGFRNGVSVTATLKRKLNGKTSNMSAFTANELASSSSASFGAYLRFDYPQLANERSYNRKIVILSPKGYVSESLVLSDTWDMPVGNYYNYYDFISFANMFDELLDKHGYVPTGTYTIQLYLDGDIAGSTAFKVN